MTLGEKCPEFRECILCYARARFNAKKLQPSEPVIVSLNFGFYFRDTRGQHLAACKRVMVCEPCLRQLFAWRHGQGMLGEEESGVGYGDAIKLMQSILDSIEGPYKGHTEAKNV